jgi:dual-specificity kinase
MPTPPTQAARKRKRATNYSVSYSEIKEYDAAGQARDVIVIEDTPPPATASPATTRNSKAFSTSYQPTSLAGPVRTRARAAREAQALSTTSSTSTIVAPPLKKRKREVHEDVGASAKKPTSYAPYQVATSKSWAGAGAAPPVEVRGATHAYRRIITK